MKWVKSNKIQLRYFPLHPKFMNSYEIDEIGEVQQDSAPLWPTPPKIHEFHEIDEIGEIEDQLRANYKEQEN